MTKLNLGGGSLRFEGFINVDLSPQADLKHDLRNPLPFEANSVDEIIAIHVIESFYQWEFPDILKDWVRVLKPGGKMSIEFTDLDDTIALYLSDNESNKQSGRWGLYGNQSRPVDPIVLHHYVWRLPEMEAMLRSLKVTSIEPTREGIYHSNVRDWRLIVIK